MANYEQLQQFINERVYNNNNNAITGSSLNYVLNRMVEILGNGYLFAGLITPESHVYTPDNNIFYIGFAGTYGQFDSQTYTVGLGEIGIFAYDGDWHVGIGQVGSGGGGGGGTIDTNNIRLSITTHPTEVIDQLDVSLQYNAGTPEVPSWLTLSTVTVDKADLRKAGLISQADYSRIYADSHQNKPNVYFPYCGLVEYSAYSVLGKEFYASCIKELWLDPEVYGDRGEYQAEYMAITKLCLRKLVNGQRVCAFKIECMHVGVVGAPIETIIDYSITLPANPTAATLVTPPALIHNADNTCVAVINWNAAVESANTGYDRTNERWPEEGLVIEAPEEIRLSSDLALFDLSYCPTIKQYLEGGGGGSFDYEKLQLYLNSNMTDSSRRTVGLRYNAGTAQDPDYESLGNVAFPEASPWGSTGHVGLIGSYPYGQLLSDLDLTKPYWDFPFKQETPANNYVIPARVIQELWIDPDVYTLQQLQNMRIMKLFVNYDDNGSTVCEFNIKVPTNLSDLTQPWEDVINYRVVVTASNKPEHIIHNADKSAWATINWNTRRIDSGIYYGPAASGTNGAFLDDTGKLFDLGYAPMIAQFRELEAKQDKLTAGPGIAINNNVISSTGGGSSFDPSTLGLVESLNMQSPSHVDIVLRHNEGTPQVPNWTILSSAVLQEALPWGDSFAGLVGNNPYGQLLSDLDQTKPHWNYPLKADSTNTLRVPARVLRELWFDPNVYTAQQVQAMRVTKLLVYNTSGNTVTCALNIKVPSNLSDLSQPWNDVINYQVTISGSTKPSQVIHNAAKSAWAIVNWNTSRVASGSYIDYNTVTDAPLLDDTDKLFDLNYAPSIAVCIDLASCVKSSTTSALETMPQNTYDNLPSVDNNAVYITY